MDPAITLRRLPAAATAAAPLALLLRPGGNPGTDRAALLVVGRCGLLRGTKRRLLPLLNVAPAAPAAAPAAAGPRKLTWRVLMPGLPPIRKGMARPWNAEAGPFLPDLCWPSTNSGPVRWPPAALLLLLAPPAAALVAPKRVVLRSGLGAAAAVAARVEAIPAGDTDRPARQQQCAKQAHAGCGWVGTGL